MTRNAIALLALCPHFINSSAAQPQHAVRVERVEYDAERSAARVTLFNTSSTEVTAFRLELTLTYRDGTSQVVGHFVDLLPIIALRTAGGKVTNFEQYEFPPGGQHTITVGVRGECIRAEANIIAVVYADRSASGQSTAVDYVFSRRTEIAQDMKAVLAITRRAMSSSPSDAEAIKALGVQEANLPPSRRNDVRKIQGVLQKGGSSRANEFLRVYELQANAYATHKERASLK